jgi:colicin import membrane protein
MATRTPRTRAARSSAPTPQEQPAPDSPATEDTPAADPAPGTDTSTDGPAPEVASEVVEAASKSTEISTRGLDPIAKIQAGIDALEKRALTLKVDTAAEEKVTRQFRQLCVSTRSALDDAYDQVNRPLLDTGRRARALRDTLKAKVAEHEAKADKMLADLDAKRAEDRRAKQAANEARVAAIRQRIEDVQLVALNAVGQSVEELDRKISMVQALELAPADYEELIDEAKANKVATLERLIRLRSVRLEADEREAEDARRRAAEQERAEALERETAAVRRYHDAVRSAIGKTAAEVRVIYEGIAGTFDPDAPAAVGHAKTGAMLDLKSLLDSAEMREKLAAEEAERQREQDERAATMAKEREAAEAAEAERQATERAAAEKLQAEQRQLQWLKDIVLECIDQPSGVISDAMNAVEACEPLSAAADEQRRKSLRVLTTLGNQAMAAEKAAAAEAERIAEQERQAEAERARQEALREAAAAHAQDLLNALVALVSVVSKGLVTGEIESALYDAKRVIAAATLQPEQPADPQVVDAEWFPEAQP